MSYWEGMSIAEVKTNIKKDFNLTKNIILMISGKQVNAADETVSLHSLHSEATHGSKVLSFTLVDYKQVVFYQQATGVWGSDLLQVLKPNFCTTTEEL